MKRIGRILPKKKIWWMNIPNASRIYNLWDLADVVSPAIYLNDSRRCSFGVCEAHTLLINLLCCCVVVVFVYLGPIKEVKTRFPMSWITATWKWLKKDLEVVFYGSEIDKRNFKYFWRLWNPFIRTEFLVMNFSPVGYLFQSHSMFI